MLNPPCAITGDEKRFSSYVSQESAGGWPWKKLVTASTSTVEGDCARKRHVSRSDRMRSTQRLPFLLAVPRDRLRQSTPKRKAHSARLFVGSTPCWISNTHQESISRSRRR